MGSSNWSTDSQGQNDPFQVPGAATNVIFTATNVAGSGALTTTLDQNYFINSLTFTVPAGTSITGVTVNTGSNSLYLGSGNNSSGLTLNAASATGGTISGPGDCDQRHSERGEQLGQRFQYPEPDGQHTDHVNLGSDFQAVSVSVASGLADVL